MPFKIYSVKDARSDTDSESDRNDTKEAFYTVKDNNNYLVEKGYIYKIVYKILISE